MGPGFRRAFLFSGFNMHPLVRIWTLLVFAAGVALGGSTALAAALGMLVLAYAIAGPAHLAGVGGMIRRIRWLLLSLLIYGWWTPGEPLLVALGAGSPTVTGLYAGLERALVLVVMVAAVHLLMKTTSREDLLGALVQLTRPLARLGFPYERFAVRVALVMELVPEMRSRLADSPVTEVSDGGRLRRLALRGRDLYQGVIRQAEADVPGVHRVAVPGACPWLHWLLPVAVALVYLGGRRVWPSGLL